MEAFGFGGGEPSPSPNESYEDRDLREQMGDSRGNERLRAYDKKMAELSERRGAMDASAVEQLLRELSATRTYARARIDYYRNESTKSRGAVKRIQDDISTSGASRSDRDFVRAAEMRAENTARRAQELEAMVATQIYAPNDLVRVERTVRDDQGEPMGKTVMEEGWFVAEFTPNGEILVKQAVGEGEKIQAQKSVDPAALERWNAAE